jgi:hypothetical protein
MYLTAAAAFAIGRALTARRTIVPGKAGFSANLAENLHYGPPWTAALCGWPPGTAGRAVKSSCDWGTTAAATRFRPKTAQVCRP